MAKKAGTMIVVAAALADGEGRVLLQRRPEGKAMAGLWEFPGGKMEEGERPGAALVRELEEELGIAVDESALEPAAFASADNGGRPMLLLLYLCRAWRGGAAGPPARAPAWGGPPDTGPPPGPPAGGP